MLIPSIDLMGGKIVQLVRGETKALEFENFDEWIRRFSDFPLVQLIDLDAAMGTGSNRNLLQRFLNKLPCQVGGGIRSIESASQVLAMGAQRVILGSTLIRDGKINVDFAEKLSRNAGIDKLVFAIDSRGGKVAIEGWREITPISPLDVIRALDAYCDAFLYTHIDTEGTMRGFPMAAASTLRRATSKQLIAAGGISSCEEIDELHEMGVDAVVGMAVYTGQIKLSPTPTRTRKPNGLEEFAVRRSSGPMSTDKVKELESEPE